MADRGYTFRRKTADRLVRMAAIDAARDRLTPPQQRRPPRSTDAVATAEVVRVAALHEADEVGNDKGPYLEVVRQLQNYPDADLGGDPPDPQPYSYEELETAFEAYPDPATFKQILGEAVLGDTGNYASNLAAFFAVDDLVYARSIQGGWLVQPKTGGSTGAWLRIKAIANDYLECVSWDGTDEGTVTIYVAKPYKLRHQLESYPQLFSIVTVDTQEIDASDGLHTEVWRVTPTYHVNDLIYAEAILPDATVMVPGPDPPGTDVAAIWHDKNRDGRAWAVYDDSVFL